MYFALFKVWMYQLMIITMTSLSLSLYIYCIVPLSMILDDGTALEMLHIYQYADTNASRLSVLKFRPM